MENVIDSLKRQAQRTNFDVAAFSFSSPLLRKGGKLLMFIDRMKSGVDEMIRREQAGFRSGRGTSEQSFCSTEYPGAVPGMPSTSVH